MKNNNDNIIDQLKTDEQDNISDDSQSDNSSSLKMNKMMVKRKNKKQNDPNQIIYNDQDLNNKSCFDKFAENNDNLNQNNNLLDNNLLEINDFNNFSLKDKKLLIRKIKKIKEKIIQKNKIKKIKEKIIQKNKIKIKFYKTKISKKQIDINSMINNSDIIYKSNKNLDSEQLSKLFLENFYSNDLSQLPYINKSLLQKNLDINVYDIKIVKENKNYQVFTDPIDKFKKFYLINHIQHKHQNKLQNCIINDENYVNIILNLNDNEVEFINQMTQNQFQLDLYLLNLNNINFIPLNIVYHRKGLQSGCYVQNCDKLKQNIHLLKICEMFLTIEFKIQILIVLQKRDYQKLNLNLETINDAIELIKNKQTKQYKYQLNINDDQQIHQSARNNKTQIKAWVIYLEEIQINFGDSKNYLKLNNIKNYTCNENWKNLFRQQTNRSSKINELFLKQFKSQDIFKTIYDLLIQMKFKIINEYQRFIFQKCNQQYNQIIDNQMKKLNTKYQKQQLNQINNIELQEINSIDQYFKNFLIIDKPKIDCSKSMTNQYNNDYFDRQRQLNKFLDNNSRIDNEQSSQQQINKNKIECLNDHEPNQKQRETIKSNIQNSMQNFINNNKSKIQTNIKTSINLSLNNNQYNNCNIKINKLNNINLNKEEDFKSISQELDFVFDCEKNIDQKEHKKTNTSHNDQNLDINSNSQYQDEKELLSNHNICDQLININLESDNHPIPQVNKQENMICARFTKNGKQLELIYNLQQQSSLIECKLLIIRNFQQQLIKYEYDLLKINLNKFKILLSKLKQKQNQCINQKFYDLLPIECQKLKKTEQIDLKQNQIDIIFENDSKIDNLRFKDFNLFNIKFNKINDDGSSDFTEFPNKELKFNNNCKNNKIVVNKTIDDNNIISLPVVIEKEDHEMNKIKNSIRIIKEERENDEKFRFKLNSNPQNRSVITAEYNSINDKIIQENIIIDNEINDNIIDHKSINDLNQDSNKYKIRNQNRHYFNQDKITNQNKNYKDSNKDKILERKVYLEDDKNNTKTDYNFKNFDNLQNKSLNNNKKNQSQYDQSDCYKTEKINTFEHELNKQCKDKDEIQFEENKVRLDSQNKIFLELDYKKRKQKCKCGKSYISKQGLKLHIQNKHDDNFLIYADSRHLNIHSTDNNNQDIQKYSDYIKQFKNFNANK